MTMRYSLGTTFIIFYILFFISSALATDDAVDHKPPNITNGKVLINQDDSFILECQGTQPLHWKYKYQEDMIDLTGEYKEPNLEGYTYRSTLNVTEHHYHGHYFCYYEGSELNDSSQSTDIFVYLNGAESGFAVLPEYSYNLNVENKKIEVGEGDSLVLDCRPTIPELNVTVKFDGKVMHDGPLPNPQMGYVIEKITPDKLGNYTCHIDDEEKKFNVVAPRKYQQPYVILAPNSFPVVGYRVDIRCVLFDDDYDTRPEFSWICQSGHSCIGGGNNRKVNTSIESIDENSERRRFINTLTLSNVSLADSGNFTCQISGQDYESSHKTLSFIVEENREPFTNVTPKVDNITCNLGENVTWTLVIGSFPPPVLKAHERFRINYKHNGDTTLTMTNVQPSDFNQYVLEINTNLTSTNATLNLKVNRETRLEGIGGVNETVLLNSTIVAVCNASGYPLEDIKWKHQFCPGRKCSGDFQEIKNGSVTVIVDKENMKSSQYTFVATDIANIECSSKMLKENKTIAVAGLSTSGLAQMEVNLQPIIGVLTQTPSDYLLGLVGENYTAMVYASYIKYIESAGSRVVPILINQDDDYYDNIASSVNGILFPGGSVSTTNTSGYGLAGQKLYEYAMRSYQEGKPLPIWGTCLGFQMIAYLGAGYHKWLTHCEASNRADPLYLQEGYQDSRMFMEMPEYIEEYMQLFNTTPNFHHWCLTPENFIKSGLSENFKMLATSYDDDGLEYVALMEHNDMPVFGSQFHPEKVPYTWATDPNHDSIPHDPFSLSVSQYLANFFVNQARLNKQQFSSVEAEEASLIYNYHPVYTGMLGASQPQTYLFH